MNDDPTSKHVADPESLEQLPAVEYTPHFDQVLQIELDEAPYLTGKFIINGSPNFAYAAYQEPGMKRSHHVSLPGLKKGDALNDALQHSQEYIDFATEHMIVYRRSQALITALEYSDIKPGDFETITDKVLERLPQYFTHRDGKSPFGQRVAETMIEQALELPPGQSQQAVSLIVARCQQFKQELGDDTATAGLVDRFTGSMAKPLGTEVTAYNQPMKTSGPGRARKPSYYGSNVVEATMILDEAGMVKPAFWQRLTHIPLGSQPLPVVTMLADKLESDSANVVLDSMSASDRVALLERAVAGALEHAAAQPGSDRRQLEGLRQLITHRGRPDSVSLDNTVKVANMIIENNYQDEITPLRPDNSFTDSAQALSVLLRFAESGTDPNDSRRDLAAFIRIKNVVIEQSKSQQTPVIKTIGDVALRYIDATPEELEALGEELEFGLPRIDAMRRQQRRAERRDAIVRPGYGQLT